MPDLLQDDGDVPIIVLVIVMQRQTEGHEVKKTVTGRSLDDELLLDYNFLLILLFIHPVAPSPPDTNTLGAARPASS